MSKAIKKKKRKLWSAAKFWRIHFKEKGYGTIYLNGQNTINSSFAEILGVPDSMLPADYDTNELSRQKAINKFAEYLDTGRLSALKQLLDAGIQVYVVGEPQIEIMSKDPQYRDEHFRRLRRQLDQKFSATEKKCVYLNDNERKERSLPTKGAGVQVRKRLLLGDGIADCKVIPLPKEQANG